MKPTIVRTTRCATVLYLNALLSAFTGFSQVNRLDEKNLEETMRNPWKAERSAFVTDWLILGPFPASSMQEIDRDFLAETGGEANVHPVQGQDVKVSGAGLKWAPTTCKDIVDLQRFFAGGKTENVVAYAYAKIVRKRAGSVWLTVGSDDGVKIWVNGKEVHRVARQREVRLDEDRVDAEMRAGENHLLLKIQQGLGGWGFAVRMLDDPNQLTLLTGNIEFTVADADRKAGTVSVASSSNLSQGFLRQVVRMEVYAAGGRTVASKAFNSSEPVVLAAKRWPDGPYEFRFTYRDIRGLTSVKYASWYKGDILGAARAAVKSAPEKNARTPEEATHRMLADMILDRLGNDLDHLDSAKFAALQLPMMEYAEFKAKNQVHPGGFLRMAYIDEIDNSPQFCKVYLPAGYDPSKKWPMVVFLHGHYDNDPEYINVWDVNTRHESASDKLNVIYITPHGRLNTGYLGIGDRDVMKCMEMAKQRFNVDEEKVYLMGASMGGFGTWSVATRHPELFAAIAPIYGGGDYHVNMSRENVAKLSSWEVFLSEKSSSTAQMEALVNMPILVSHGDQDQLVDVNLSRYLVRMLQRWNYNVRYMEVPGKGHQDLGLGDQIVEWLLQHKRVVSPAHVRVRAADLRSASAYWVEVSQRKSPSEFMEVDAEALEGNVLRVDSKNVLEASLTPGKVLVDYSKPVTVVWNGRKREFQGLTAKGIVLRDENYKALSIPKTRKIAGPVADYQNTPYLIVIGTTSAEPALKALIARKAGDMVNAWRSAQKYEPRVKDDVDVTEAEMKTYSLYLLGGASENKVSKLVLGRIPIQVNADEILIDGKSIKAKDAVLNAVYPNPFNNERYVVLAVGTSAAGLALFDPHRNDLAQFDFTVTDGVIPHYSVGATNEKIMIGSGFFDCNWKADDALFSRGDEALRSKCAFAALNGDGSMRIVSKARPSAEVMKAHMGMYQIQGGPLLRIYLDHDTLKVAQGPQFSAIMHPVSDNEYYVQEVQGSLGFGKNEETNAYEMSINLSGQHYTARRMP